MSSSSDDARLKLIRAGHTEVCDGACGDCNAAWPCDTALVLARLDALTAENARLREGHKS